MLGILSAIRFLFMAPLILIFLGVINLMTSPGIWWVQWAALGLGIAWFVNLFRVIQAVVFAGGVAALGYYLWKRFGNDAGHPYGWHPPAGRPAPQPATVDVRFPN